KEPIVFYVGRGVPEFLRPYVKAGIEQWQPAFESAGFKNAIIGKYAPSEEEDPNWDAEDATISTIRWLPADIKNAFGPHVHDPRTGEILEADVRMYHNVMTLVRDWYFVQAAACDERAQKLPMPNDLMGELVQFVVAHEVGHSLGLPHNFKASASYTVEQLRDPEWTKANGTAPSIMDYARFNYVAQPGDGAALLPAIGPYDHYSIEWGYRQFDDDEKAGLEALAKKQIDEPMYRFGGGRGDPTTQTEDLTGDAVEATRLGIENLKRIAGFMVEATCEEGEDYGLLENMYDQLWGQWNREIGHVISYVGGIEEINLWYGDADKRYFEVSPERQRAAVEFLIENALGEPEAAMVNEDITLRLSATGVADRVAGAQARVLRSLMSAGRIDRMSEVASRTDDAYAPSEMLDDLREAVFGEGMVAISSLTLRERNLQRAYVDILIDAMNGTSATSDFPALARRQLQMVRSRIRIGRADDVTQAHLSELRSRILDALDPHGRAESSGGS
ncbi:MAG: zinc-dependent metalloprotease, partial [Phycisphaerales bacterium]